MLLCFIHPRFQVTQVVNNLPAKCRRHKRCGFDTWVRKILWRKKWQPTRRRLLNVCKPKKIGQERSFSKTHVQHGITEKVKLAAISLRCFLLWLASTELHIVYGRLSSKWLRLHPWWRHSLHRKYSKTTVLSAFWMMIILFLHSWWVMRHQKRRLGLVKLWSIICKSWAQNPY